MLLLVQARSQLPDVYRDLAELARRRGCLDDAHRWQSRWLSLPAEDVKQLWHQACAAEQQGSADLAVERYLQLLQLDPHHLGALERAVALQLRSGHWTMALPLLEKLLEQQPDHPSHLADSAFCALMLSKSTQAEAYARRCLDASQSSSFTSSDLRQAQAVCRAVQARLIQHDGDEIAALQLGERAREEASGAWPISCILAPLYLNQHLLPKASDLIEEALQLQPESAKLHILKADLCLLSGDLQRGFQELQWRCTKAIHGHQHTLPQWQDHQSEGPIALLAESSLGDTLLFSRYASWIQTQTQRKVLLYVQPPLLDLLRCSLQPLVSVLPHGQLAAQRQGCLLPLLSAPAQFGTCQEHGELTKPHLRADPELVVSWKQQLDCHEDELLIGINWHGSALHALSEGHRSDIPLHLFKPIADLPGVRLVAFQKGIGSEQLHDCSFHERFINSQPMVSQELRLAHMAAVMQLCDWVVSDDSGPSHLAGNLGIPSLVLLPERPNWRWASTCEHSPWYPNSRLLRKQPGKGWSELIEQVCQQISAHRLPRRGV
ncbi:glycosyltransferase family 9 protein [Synechococcus sp. 8F6]|uniref:glycosyltransferase family 9 protein n=1 Tax=Synechococcus sp. 8F6 TaxID=2025606 RepID=UPI000B97E0EE|nr:glycosyltransferase family 9 protein [Synechococcus sp. 8F6]